MTEEFAIGDVLFRQFRLDHEEKIERPYDLIVAGLSWETRGVVALAHLRNANADVELWKFQSQSDVVEKAKARQLEKFRALFSNIKVVELGSSTDVESNFVRIKSRLHDAYARAGRPLSVLVDMTCLPKTYTLFMVGLGFREELVARIDCLYTPGEYDLISANTNSSPVVAGPRSLLSEGEWHSRQIPYLEASEYIANDLDLLVSLGGELGLTLPFMERFEPRRLGLVFIDETSPENGTPMLPSERLAYEELLSEPNTIKKGLPLCDAVGMAHHALTFARESSARGTTMMAIGAKPHALALGLVALADSRVEVVCRTPASYRPVDVKPSGEPMLYEIEDRFDPASYLAQQ